MAHILVKNLSANLFAQIVTSATILVLVPLYFAAWGTNLYGVWLVLVAIPGMFTAVSDGGFIPVAGNDMTMLFAQGKREDVVRLFQSSWLFVTAMSLVILGGAGVGIAAYGIGSLIDVAVISKHEAQIILTSLLTVGLVNFQLSLTITALRAVGRLAEANFASNLVLICESVAIGGALLFGAPVFVVALITLAGRAIAFAASRVLLHKYTPWLRYGVIMARWSDIRQLLFPSVSYLSFPVGNAAIFQGLLIVIGHVLGSTSVALFSTTRTAANFLVQLIGIFSYASWPELSRQFGLGRRDSIATYLTHGTQLAAILCIVLGSVLIIGAPIIFSLWTSGRMEADRVLVALLTFAATMATLRAYPATILLATNQHIRFSIAYLAICFAVVGAAYLVSPTLGVRGVAAVVTVGELSILILSMTLVLALIGQGIEPIKRVFTARPPLKRLLMRR